MRRTPGWVRLLAAMVSVLSFLSAVVPVPRSSWTYSARDRWWWQPPKASIVDANGDVVVLDPYATSARIVADVHEQGRAAICHLRAGLWEPGQPDAGRVDTRLIGLAADTGGPAQPGGARWLDVRGWHRLADVFADRFALCVAKGFDGVALSEMDGYAHPTGFPLSLADQAAFNQSLVRLAHSHALVVGIVARSGGPDSLVRGAHVIVAAHA